MEECKDTMENLSDQEADVSVTDIAADWNGSGESSHTAEKPEVRTSNSGESAKNDAAADWPDSESAATGEKTSTGAADGRKADQSFTLKHLGAVKTVGRDEVVTLAQKGLDYDRQRQRNDELLSRNKALAAEAEQQRAQRGAAPIPGARLMTREEAMAQRQSNEISEFISEYKNLDPKDIPQEVWQAVIGGKPLLAAYQAWELKKLRGESMASSKATENREKSVGSRTSAGSARHMDAITADWYSS